ncbi:MAG: class I SAM-dependent methyltransferase [Desulfobacterales bacterium]|nr:class I SAM-dependent methyltransferase [Desulfobacterales bacterium]
MNEIIYNSIGTNYNTNRAADYRIINILKDLLELPTGSTIADIGAGTGNYSNAFADLGYKIKAVEPSEEMRKQAKPNNNITWLSGTAESIPLPDNSVDGVIIVLAIHHFSSLKDASAEMQRICPNGPIVVFTLDPRKGEEPWFKDYFPEIYEQDFKSFPPIDTVANTIAMNGSWAWEIKSFPLPDDLSDKNMYSAWNGPERYFDPQFRQNTSGLAKASQNIVQTGLEKLKHDMEAGIWDKKYGHLRTQKEFDAGFRFVRFGSKK